MIKTRINKEKGITLTILVITITLILILTGTVVYNAQGSLRIRMLTNLINDIETLDEKVSDYYNEYGDIPAKVKYTNIDNLKNAGILSTNDDLESFYVLDLEAMQGVSLNYGKDYEKIKNVNQNSTQEENKLGESMDANQYKDIYIINKNSHNIFLVKGITITKDNIKTTYYTNYSKPDNTVVDLRYIDGILIPNEIKKSDGTIIQNKYYYIGKDKDSSGNESVVISTNKDDSIDKGNTSQYVWQKYISIMDKIPDSVTLNENQLESEFIESVNYWKGYFKNSEGKVIYNKTDF